MCLGRPAVGGDVKAELSLSSNILFLMSDGVRCQSRKTAAHNNVQLLDAYVQLLDAKAIPCCHFPMPRKQSPDAKTLVLLSRKTSAAARRRAEGLLAEIERRKEHIKKEFILIGRALLELETRKLFGALGYATFDDMLRERAVLGRSQAYKLLAITKELPDKKALSLGIEKAYALARLAAATATTKDSAKSLAKTGVRIEGRTRRVADLSATAIRKQAHRVRSARSNARHEPARHSAQALTRAAERALRAAGVETAEISAYRREDRWRVRIDVPIAYLEQLTMRE